MRISITILFAIIILGSCTTTPEKTPPGYSAQNHDLEIIEGVHVETGLADDPNLPIIIANCTGCHSAKLITQNRATREGWKNMIVWMQATQKLWDLGENEEVILDYLESNYAPQQSASRRQILTDIEWYQLD